MESEIFLPRYSVRFANMWCEIEGIEIPLKLLDAGVSSIKICGEFEEQISFPKDIDAKLLFKHQDFNMKLELIESEESDKYFNYLMRVKLENESDFKKWLTFIKSIYGLYLKKSQSS